MYVKSINNGCIRYAMYLPEGSNVFKYVREFKIVSPIMFDDSKKCEFCSLPVTGEFVKTPNCSDISENEFVIRKAIPLKTYLDKKGIKLKGSLISLEEVIDIEQHFDEDLLLNLIHDIVYKEAENENTIGF